MMRMRMRSVTLRRSSILGITIRPEWLHLWPLLLPPLLLLLPGLGDFPYPSREAAYSDLTISHYPNALWIVRSLQEWGQVPLWSSGILSGYPFFANPLSGLYYPPGWLALLFPLPLGFNVLVALHLLLGGIGMYRLLRVEGLDHLPSLAGALACSALPKLFAHYGAGHLTLLYAVPWTPWLLSSVEGQKVGKLKDGAKTFILPSLNLQPAIILALIILADPRWGIYAGALWWAWALFKAGGWKVRKLRLEPKTFHLQPIPRLVIQTVLAGMLAAPLLLPLLEYTRLSTRRMMDAADVLTLSLPPARLLGLVIPDFGGQHEWTLYPGAGFLLLAVLAVVWRRDRVVHFWAGVVALALLLALGSYLPPLQVLARLPVLELLRVPARATFVAGFGMAALVGYAMQALISGEIWNTGRRRGSLLLVGWTAGVLALDMAIGVAIYNATGSFPLNILWGAGFTLGTSLLVSLGLRGFSGIGWASLLIGVCLLDILVVSRSLLTFRNPEETLLEGRAAIEWIAAQGEGVRVYSPSYSLPQHTAMQAGVELADGVDPLQLLNYAAFLSTAGGFTQQSYSVTLPPFPTGDPVHDNAKLEPDAALLGQLNVGYVAAEFDLDSPGLTRIARFGQTRLYSNSLALSRAWVQPVDVPIGEAAQAIEIESWSPNRIALIVPAAEEGVTRLLVLSELDYPGWQVQVDAGAQTPVRGAGLFRAVRLDAHPHQIIFAFHPVSLYLGLLLGMIGLAVIGLDLARKKPNGL